MKKRILAGLFAALFLLSACAPAAQTDDGKLHVVATTYPVYLFATAITEGVEAVEVSLMIRQPTSCLHDYTLTVTDMKTLAAADVVLMNGAGLEDFMADALARSDAKIIDCSEGIDLLLSEEHEGHDGHDHDEEYDPHYWLDLNRAVKMALNITTGLEKVFFDDPGLVADLHTIRANCNGIENLLDHLPEKLGDFSVLPHKELITFHDGFRYFADFLGLDILKAIEEEAGSEASAQEIVEVTDLIKTHGLPAIFTEVNGSEATAKAVARETGVNIYQLDMIMSGNGVGIQPYIDAMNSNIETVLEALG